MHNMLPYSEACARNQDHILARLSSLLPGPATVLEIGSGTAQHAVYFAGHLPGLTWVCSDVADNIDGIQAQLNAANRSNIRGPLTLDVSNRPWPIDQADAIFTANSLHIMSSGHVEQFIDNSGDILNTTGLLIVYGPFKYAGEFTTPSNANFDLWLKRRDSMSGVRDFEWVNELAGKQGLELSLDLPMPANNQLLVWRRG
jgi:SAM-dependent methyltransferase